MRFHQVVEVEVTNAVIANRSRCLERLKCREGLRDWYRPAPVKEIQIEIVCAEPPQAALAGSGRAPQRRVVRINLTDEEHRFPAACDRLADQSFRLAFAIHLRRINKRHPEIQS